MDVVVVPEKNGSLPITWTPLFKAGDNPKAEVVSVMEPGPTVVADSRVLGGEGGSRGQQGQRWWERRSRRRWRWCRRSIRWTRWTRLRKKTRRCRRWRWRRRRWWCWRLGRRGRRWCCCRCCCCCCCRRREGEEVEEEEEEEENDGGGRGTGKRSVQTGFRLTLSALQSGYSVRLIGRCWHTWRSQFATDSPFTGSPLSFVAAVLLSLSVRKYPSTVSRRPALSQPPRGSSSPPPPFENRRRRRWRTHHENELQLCQVVQLLALPHSKLIPLTQILTRPVQCRYMLIFGIGKAFFFHGSSPILNLVIQCIIVQPWISATCSFIFFLPVCFDAVVVDSTHGYLVSGWVYSAGVGTVRSLSGGVEHDWKPDWLCWISPSFGRVLIDLTSSTLCLFLFRVVDSDGEFLLVEAADNLPKWAAKPENCVNRVRCGKNKQPVVGAGPQR